MMSKNVISLCLFGDDPVYCQGAVRNAELIKAIYPEWRMRVYLGGVSPVKKALANAGVELVDSGKLNPMLARFLVASDKNVARFLVRDADSRFNKRERAAVDEWLASGKSFHVIRDHPNHNVVMGGGLWGGVGGALNIKALLKEWNGNKSPGKRDAIYNQDQVFLREKVWPLVKSDCFQHDFCLHRFFHGAHEFPAKAHDYRFCGERFDANDQPEPASWEMRINWLKYE